jgi:acetyl esterase/lipase
MFSQHVTAMNAFAFLLAAAFATIRPDAAAAAGPDGSVTIEKLHIPLSDTLSPEMRDSLINHPWPHLSPDKQEAFMQDVAAKKNENATKRFDAKVVHEEWSGVPVNIITPGKIAKGADDAILLHIHGGGFRSCAKACSYSEAIPIAGLSGVQTVSVDYTLVPEAQFPFAVEQIISVYRKLLAHHRPSKIAIFGSSAGAVLTGEVTARLIKDGLPVPAALGIFSGSANLSENGDSPSFYTISGVADNGHNGSEILEKNALAYAGQTDLHDPLLSPVYSDLSKFPPTLLMTSTRDLLLSETGNFERALHKAGVETQLVIFDGLYHTFWLNAGTPETEEALTRQACFLATRVGANTLQVPACKRQ